MTLPASTEKLYRDYVARMRKIADFKNAGALLQWDQETYLPELGFAFRGQQMATLAEEAHHLFTRPGTGSLLEELRGRQDLSTSQKKNISLSWEDYLRQKKYKSGFVRQLSETTSKSFQSWIRARKENSFAYFEKELGSVLVLKKQEAEMLGYLAHPYDALLDEFEKSSTVSRLDGFFAAIRQPLKDLLEKISVGNPPDNAFLRQHFPKNAQWDFGISMARGLGFDFSAGRQDLSEHPFTTSFNPSDVRITTRVDEKDLASMTWTTIHETGHALYEQGLPPAEYGLPLGEYASLGMHESQSRLWENNLGRSLGFWRHWYPRLQKVFPSQLRDISLEAFYAGINRVSPSLIRTEADELTYHFHVMIRYELEKQLITGDVKVAEIPEYWNQHYRGWLGLNVPGDKLGCLQDVHWSHGSFGYFPTYSLGSFYAAQFFAAARDQIRGLEEEISRGQTKPLLDWLRISIHGWGRSYSSEELCERICGKPLDSQCFLKYLLDKYRKIYDF